VMYMPPYAQVRPPPAPKPVTQPRARNPPGGVARRRHTGHRHRAFLQVSPTNCAHPVTARNRSSRRRRLCPAHPHVAGGASSTSFLAPGTSPRRCDRRPQHRMRGEHAVVARQTHARRRHQRRETRQKIQRLEHHVCVSDGPSPQRMHLRRSKRTRRAEQCIARKEGARAARPRLSRS
jgi:hypothetical protein